MQAILRPHCAGMIMDETVQDWADRFGMHVSTIAIVILFAMFIYGYLGRLVFG